MKMEIEIFKQKTRKASATSIETAQKPRDMRVSVTPNRRLFRIVREHKCDKCKITHKRNLLVLFKEPQEPLSIFQVVMLYMLFVEGKKPADYARYHECQAGKKFIENIEMVSVENE